MRLARIAGARAERKEARKARAYYGVGPVTWMADDYIHRKGLEARHRASARVAGAILRLTTVKFLGR